MTEMRIVRTINVVVSTDGVGQVTLIVKSARCVFDKHMVTVRKIS